MLLLLLNHGDRLMLLLLLKHCGVNEHRSQLDSGIVANLHLYHTGIHHLSTTLGHYQQVVIVLRDHIFTCFSLIIHCLRGGGHEDVVYFPADR